MTASASCTPLDKSRTPSSKAGKRRPARAHVADYIGLLHASEQRLVKAFEQVQATYPDEPDSGPLCQLNWLHDRLRQAAPQTLVVPS